MTRHARHPAVAAAAAAVLLFAGAGRAQADEAEGRTPFLFVNELGDLAQATGRGGDGLHVTGVLGMETAGYFRGVFDDVPEDLDSLEWGPTLRLTYAFPSHGFLRNPSLTIGSGNNFWTNGEIPASGSPENWFESDNFVGVSAGLGENWRAGLTFTHYGSPNNASPEFQEVAVAVQSLAVPLSPQFKVVVPADDAEGVFMKLSAAPTLGKLALTPERDLTFAAPVAFGLGLGDYYGAGTDTSGYAQLGVAASMPLGLPQPYGDWSVGASFTGILRPDELAAADPPGKEAGNLVLRGGVSLSLAF